MISAHGVDGLLLSHGDDYSTALLVRGMRMLDANPGLQIFSRIDRSKLLVVRNAEFPRMVAFSPGRHLQAPTWRVTKEIKLAKNNGSD